jgi:hypothetical protein
MDSSVLSALSGLGGVVVGGLTSFATSWFVQQAQLREKHLEQERSKRESLFGEFFGEASRLYGDALSHEKDDVTDLVKLYALVAQMRLGCSQRVVAEAERTMDAIIATYLAPNRTLHEMRAYAQQGGMNFLVGFSEACRDDLAFKTPRRWS